MVKANYRYLFLLAIVLLPYIALCFFAHPIADDFGYARKTIGWGYWHAQVYDFLHWNGRYFSNALLMATPLCWHSFFGYRLVALCLILLAPSSIFFLLSSLDNKSLDLKEKLIASVVTSALLFGMLPSLVEGVYWMTGSVTYILGDIVAIFYTGLILRYIKKEYIMSPSSHFLLCAILLLMAMGFNEVLTLILLLAHFSVWLSLDIKEKLQRNWLLLGGLILTSTLIVILAPGNSYRSSLFHNTHELFYSLGMSILQVCRFLFLWITYIPLLLASILFIGIGNRLYSKSALFKQLAGIPIWKALAILILIPFLAVFPVYWSTGVLGQHRTLNAACFLFLPAWFIFVYAISLRMGLVSMYRILNNKTKQILLTSTCILLLFSGNSSRALKEFANGEISGFDQEMNERYAKIETIKLDGTGTVSLSPLKNKPTSLFFLDITPDCDYWINNSYAVYFGLNKVCMDTIHK